MLMTIEKKSDYEKQLANAREKKLEALQAAEAARGLADLSENAEYSSAIDNVKRYNKEILELEEILNEAKIVSEDSSPNIIVGSKIRVEHLDKETKQVIPMINEKGESVPYRTFVLEEKGDSIHKGSIGIDSPLGKVILNGLSGEYLVAVQNGILYRVTKM